MTLTPPTHGSIKTLSNKIGKPHEKVWQMPGFFRSIARAVGQSRKIALTISLSTLLAACSSIGGTPQGLVIATPIESPTIRPPAIGQQWVYQVRDVFSQAIVDELTETIVSTAPNIRIQRISKKTGPLPDEIQSQWGMLTQDAHWEQPISFSKPIPAWPVSFELKHPLSYSDQYQLLAQPYYSYYWNLTVTPRDWRSITVPAGEFKTLYYTNRIEFQSHESYFRISSERDDATWFSPEIGRWVLRRSQGSYEVAGNGGNRLENFLQWELISWH